MAGYIPPRFRSIFDFDRLNEVQSTLCEEIFKSKRSLVVSAPTGCGKTVLFELNIIKFLMEFENQMPVDNVSVLYIAPLKSLCNEKFKEWVNRFRSSTELKCILATGDSESLDFGQLFGMTLVVTTPEKMDNSIRNSTNFKSYVNSIKYCFVDEVHLLVDPDRGPLLESLMTRIKRIANPRFLCVSATMSNSGELAEWLSDPCSPAIFYSFGEEFRPAIVKKLVLSYYQPTGQSLFQFDAHLNHKLADIIKTHSSNKPVMIFCTTRRGTSQVARDLIKNNQFTMDVVMDRMRHAYGNRIRDGQLRECLLSGVGYHHAGLDTDDRLVVEQAFIAGCLPILASTSTLSMGLNLPAHLVIVKNTQQLINGEWQGYTSTQLSQMIGRAGRPQFDTEGIAIIMTSHQLKRHYEQLLNQVDCIESQLHNKLTESLNDEIALVSLHNLQDCVDWMKTTFLYVRMKNNPQQYGIKQSTNDLNSYMEIKCSHELKTLQQSGLIVYDTQAQPLRCTKLGEMMMRKRMEFNTMRMIWNLTGEETLEDLVHFVACCSELRDISLRNDEKTLLNTLNRANGYNALRFPLKGRIQTVPMKIACLLQARLGERSISGYALQQDALRIMHCAKRVIDVLSNLLWLDDYDEDDQLRENPATPLFPPVCFKYKCMVNVMEFKKSLQFGCWLNRPLTALLGNQVLSNVDVEKLIMAGMMTVGRIEKLSASQLEKILDKNSPFGLQLIQLVKNIPKYQISIEKVPCAQSEFVQLRFSLNVTTHCATDNVFVLIGDGGNDLIGKYRFKSTDLVGCGVFEIISVDPSKGDRVSFSVISTNFAGIDLHTNFAINRYLGEEALVASQPTVSTLHSACLPPAVSLGFAEEQIHQHSPFSRPTDPLDKFTIQWPTVNGTSDPISTQSETILTAFEEREPRMVRSALQKNRGIRANFTRAFKSQNPKLNATFTWIPKTPDCKPLTPMIQTSMLEYMKTKKNVSHSPKPIVHETKILDDNLHNNDVSLPNPIYSTPNIASETRRKTFQWKPISCPIPNNNCSTLEMSANTSTQESSNLINAVSMSIDTDEYTESTGLIQAMKPQLDEAPYSPVAVTADEAVEQYVTKQNSMMEFRVKSDPQTILATPGAYVKCSMSDALQYIQREINTNQEFTTPNIRRPSDVMCDDSSSAPTTFDQYAHSHNTHRYNRFLFNMTPLSDPTVRCEFGGTSEAVPNRFHNEDDSPSNQTPLPPRTNRSTSEFCEPADINFQQLLRKWRRLDKEPIANPSTNSIDTDLINDGWPELACWIYVTQLSPTYGLEDTFLHSADMETPLLSKHNHTKRLQDESQCADETVTYKVKITETMLDQSHEVDLDRATNMITQNEE